MPEHRFASLIADETGATAIEYGLVATLIALACFAAIAGLGDEVETQYNTVSSEYTAANTAANGGA